MTMLVLNPEIRLLIAQTAMDAAHDSQFLAHLEQEALQLQKQGIRVPEEWPGVFMGDSAEIVGESE